MADVVAWIDKYNISRKTALSLFNIILVLLPVIILKSGISYLNIGDMFMDYDIMFDFECEVV